MSEPPFRYDVAPRPAPEDGHSGPTVLPRFLDFPWLPDELVSQADREQAAADTARRRSLTAGDPVSIDYGNPIAQIDTQAHEFAARRLSLYGVEEPTVVAERVRGIVAHTPLEEAKLLSATIGTTVLLKREDLQPDVHSFKIRGAANSIFKLNPSLAPEGVLTVSAGNHAQGVAKAAKERGIDATVIMPATTPELKVEAVRRFGARVILHGDNYSEAAEHAVTVLTEGKQVLVHPFDDRDVIAGQGLVGSEIIADRPDVTYIFVPIGGGGLASGILQNVKIVHPEIKVIGVQPRDSSAMHRSLEAGERVTLDHVGTFADGVAVKEVGARTFDVVHRYIDGIITVDEEELCVAIADIHQETRVYPEPAGALAVAGLKKYAEAHDMTGQVAACIVSGANMAPEKLQNVLRQLKLASGKEALFSVRLPEKNGALHDFCRLIDSHNIVEFHYRDDGTEEGKVLIGFNVIDQADRAQLVIDIKNTDYPHRDFSNDTFAKRHLRSMIGGKSATNGEYIYEINFAERAGALTAFLDALADRWGISLFDYTAQGGDTGTVIIGFRVEDPAELETTLRTRNYRFAPVTSEAAKEFL